MRKKDKRVDDYIANAQPFAKPILRHLRMLVHKACPDVQETIKWSFVSFDYKGLFCGMAAFKQHASFGFWKSKLLKDPKGYLQDNKDSAEKSMGSFGKITSLKDLPPDEIIIDFLEQAKKLNDQGIKLPKIKKEKKELIIPNYFQEILKQNKKAMTVFENFSYSNQKEYVEWITEAKTDLTRQKRMDTAIEWLKQGKQRNWKYIK